VAEKERTILTPLKFLTVSESRVACLMPEALISTGTSVRTSLPGGTVMLPNKKARGQSTGTGQ